MLRAAYWVTRVLGETGSPPAEARSLWPSLPLAGEIDIAELDVAERHLCSAGLVRDEAGVRTPTPALHTACTPPAPLGLEPLLACLLEASPPLWLLTAGGDGTSLANELIPDEVEEGLATVIRDPERREAFLLARARTVDLARTASIGSDGEAAVVAACRAELLALGGWELAQEVVRVSEISDELGYDVVAPRVDGSVRRLEVKTTRSSAPRAPVYLTRNELDTGCVDPDWSLVIVREERQGGHSILGHVRAAGLGHLLPVDREKGGRWQVAKLRIPTTDLVPGLPPAAA